MDFSHTVLPLNQIASDCYFRISCATDIDALVRSMAQCGLINPPVVIEREEHLSVVCGFGRVAAARRLGWTDIPARRLKPDTPAEVCVQIAIIDNSSQRTLNLCEQVRAIGLLSRLIADPGRLTSCAQACGLPLNHKVVRDLLKIAQLPPVLEPGLIGGAIALPVAARLADMKERSEAEMLGRLLIELDLSLNRQREVIDWIEGIARRENSKIGPILESEGLARLRKNAQLDQRQKATLIRQHLKSLRFPSITAAEREFEMLRRRLNLPATIQLTPPPGFESRSYCLQLQVTCMQDLVNGERELHRLTLSSEFAALFE